MSTELLSELKKLQHERSNSSPFASHIEFLQWTDNVSPLLAFNPILQESINRHILRAKHQQRRGHSNIEDINEAIGILNQAILLLENPHPKTLAPTKQLEMPTKVTLKWLYENLPAPLVIGAIGLVVTAFCAGLFFSENKFYSLIMSKVTNTSLENIPANSNDKK